MFDEHMKLYLTYELNCVNQNTPALRHTPDINSCIHCAKGFSHKEALSNKVAREPKAREKIDPALRLPQKFNSNNSLNFHIGAE